MTCLPSWGSIKIRVYASIQYVMQRFDISAEFESYVNDYKMNLFEIAYLTHEQVEMFQSDFRVIVDYFVQKQVKMIIMQNRKS